MAESSHTDTSKTSQQVAPGDDRSLVKAEDRPGAVVVTQGLEESESLASASQWQLMWVKFKHHKLAVSAGVVLLIFYVSALFSGFVGPYDPNRRIRGFAEAPPTNIHFVDEAGEFHLIPFVYGMEQETDLETLQRVYVDQTDERYRLQLFSQGDEYRLLGIFPVSLHLFGVEEGGHFFLLGTDKQGRDLFSQIVHGGRISLSIGLVGVLLSFFIGIVLGGISGYFGGFIDSVIQRLIEVIRSFPSLPLWMALGAALPIDWPVTRLYFAITVVLSLIGWTTMARVVRGKFLSLREEDFVVAAELAGAKPRRLMFRHMLPSFMSHIIATASLSIPQMIIAETALSFLGLGLRRPAISWGVLLQQAQNVQALALTPWLLFAALPVVLTVLAFNFFGDGVRDAADPYS